MTRYESAKEIYAKLGVDTDAAIEKCMQVPVSLHCWQGDDVTGFDHDGPLTGGIQTTGNYPGKARTPCRLQHSTIGRLRLNHRVRDGNGCDPQAHRHRKFSVISQKLPLPLDNSTIRQPLLFLP